MKTSISNKTQNAIFLLALVFTTSTHALAWIDHIQHRFHQIWTEGHNDLYVTGYAWHNRYTYSPEKIKSFNELAWGGGLGKGFVDEDGDWHGIYAFGFSDSHKNFEPVLGYAYQKTLPIKENISAGIGFTVLVTARPDINNHIPFPGALPWVSLNIHRFTLGATYIPGSKGAGNVLFMVGKIQLDDGI